MMDEQELLEQKQQIIDYLQRRSLEEYGYDILDVNPTSLEDYVNFFLESYKINMLKEVDE